MNTTTYPMSLSQNGWTKQDECRCGGIHKVKFINRQYPNVIVEWWVKYYDFLVTKNNQTVQPRKPIKDLQAWLVTFAAEQDALKQTPQQPKTEKAADTKAEPVKAETAPVAVEPEHIDFAEATEKVVQEVKKDLGKTEASTKKTSKK